MQRTVIASTGCWSVVWGGSRPRMRSRRRSSARCARTASLRHPEQLGAWVTTIAERVVIDAQRRNRSTDEFRESETWGGRPPHAELERLAGVLPATERAAVVLRYGYDLDYEQIGAVLGSMRQPPGRPPRPVFAVCERS